ncbi:MAG: hypothetical protein BGO08_13030 [Altererythrobacter sp. 66-12]|nr:MAG: hypothetical protein BGO08_13030 [Altererythrobacter sp. 66-12]
MEDEGPIRSLINWWERRAGYRAASREIEHFLDGYFSDEEIIANRKNVFRGRRGTFQGPFTRGWERRWGEFGAADARSGRFRGERFRCHEYELAWSQVLEERRSFGWHNPRLEDERNKQKR